MASSPDLFVVCKNCGSEVSPYITECPYCGTRLRKRAPKIERDGTVSEPKPKKQKARRAARSPRRPRADVRSVVDSRPWATLTLVLLSLFGYLLLSVVARADVAVAGPIDGQWWRVVASPFVYGSAWYELAALIAIGTFGWLLEQRYGPQGFTVSACSCSAARAASPSRRRSTQHASPRRQRRRPRAACAWAVPDLLARARGEEYDGDLLGTLVIALVLLLMPLAVPEASAIAGFAGAALGLLCGLALARTDVA